MPALEIFCPRLTTAELQRPPPETGEEAAVQRTGTSAIELVSRSRALRRQSVMRRWIAGGVRISSRTLSEHLKHGGPDVVTKLNSMHDGGEVRGRGAS